MDQGDKEVRDTSSEHDYTREELKAIVVAIQDDITESNYPLNSPEDIELRDEYQHWMQMYERKIEYVGDAA